MPSSALVRFWEQHPCLLYGLAMLLGVAFALDFRWEWLIPSCFLFLPLLLPHSSLAPRLALALILALGSATYVSTYYHFPNLPAEGSRGTAIFTPHALIKSHSHIGSRWIYKGSSTFFSANGGVLAKNIPLQISLADSALTVRPPSDRGYEIEGTLKQGDEGYYLFKPEKSAPWKPIESSRNVSEWRYTAKQAVKEYINRHVSNEQSAIFLGGLATGEFEDRLMMHELGRFGLQHIMAISGFHFAIIAMMLSVILRLILPKKSSSLILMFLLSSYFVFLGASASILRAWIAIVLALCGMLFQKRASGLNSLGFGLIVLLILDPLMVRGIGFQFSFAVTGSILLLFSTWDTGIELLVEKRGLFYTALMNRYNQHAYLLIQGIRQGIALAFAVNLAALPLLLYHFHKFPLMSLLFNLFFPFLISIAMLLLIVGIFLPALHSINSVYTGAVLSLTYKMPQSMDLYLRIEGFPLWILITYLSLLFLASICTRDHFWNEKQAMKELAYI